MKMTAVVPIRAHSKGLPGKNTRLLAGKPLYRHSVDCARSAGITDVVVATDDPTVLALQDTDFTTYARSGHSARDDAPTHEVLIELIAALDLHDHLIVLLQATSPLRRPETVQKVVAAMSDPQVKLACSVSQIDKGLLKSGTLEDGYLRPVIDAATLFRPRQSLPDVYKMDGGVYAFRGGWLVDNGSLETDRIRAVPSDPSEVLDIDTQADFDRAVMIMSGLQPD